MAPHHQLGVSPQLGLIALVALVCAACAASSPETNKPSASQALSSPAASPSPSQSAGPLLTGTITVSGPYSVTAPFSSHAEVLVGASLTPPLASQTCTDYADGFAQSPTSFAAPEVQTAGQTGLYLQATIANGYHGPGTYTSRSTPALGGTVAVQRGDPNLSGFVDTFRSGSQSTTTLTVKRDGSGTLDFSSWGDGLSGTVSWTCP